MILEEIDLIKKQLDELRQLMKQQKMDVYLIPTADFHQSEYVGEHFAARKFMSGFTGSAGSMVVTQSEAGLWTDGRYFIQAEHQLAGSGITLYKMGVAGVPTLEEFIYDRLPEGGVLGFDGRVIDANLGKKLEEKIASKKATISYEMDLVNEVWNNRPALSKEPVYLLEERYSGKSAAAKLAELRQSMKEVDATTFVLTSLDDIAWLFNIRGNDIPCVPVVLSYAVITMESAELFVNQETISDEVREDLNRQGVQITEYEKIYDRVSEIDSTEVVLIDGSRVNYKIARLIPEEVKILRQINPTTLAKAKKNEVEIQNLRNAHIKDGVAVTKFMYWLKMNLGTTKMTELSAADYLENLRKQQEGYIEPSFHTISAFGANAAMMHYSATEESNATLEPGSFLLVDSGGHYYEGSTDITRTFALGEISPELKKHFTLVTKSNLNLANAKFLHGCTGMNLDILARGPLWELGIDYRCGTGHGIGYLLNVHEAPNGFRWKIVPERNDSCILEPGMVTTDEPGVYIEGSHGIRIENELVCRKDETNEYGDFLNFENITYAPIDLDAIDPAYLQPKDIEQLNCYHKKVFEKISPYLTYEECEWLKKYTRAI